MVVICLDLYFTFIFTKCLYITRLFFTLGLKCWKTCVLIHSLTWSVSWSVKPFHWNKDWDVGTDVISHTGDWIPVLFIASFSLPKVVLSQELVYLFKFSGDGKTNRKPQAVAWTGWTILSVQSTKGIIVITEITVVSGLATHKRQVVQSFL